MTRAYYQYKTSLKELVSFGLAFVSENPFGSHLRSECCVQSDLAIWSVCSSATNSGSSHPGNNSNSGQRSGDLPLFVQNPKKSGVRFTNFKILLLLVRLISSLEITMLTV